MNDIDVSLREFFQESSGSLPLAADAQYKCSKVPVQYSLELPIPITINGSTIRYAFGTDGADISFGIYFRKISSTSTDAAHSLVAPSSEASIPPRPASPSTDDDVALVPPSRVDSHLSPISGSFVITEEAPCVVMLCWDNRTYLSMISFLITNENFPS